MAQTVDVTTRTLETTPERALRFLRGVARSAGIRSKLQARGYTQAEHGRGWTLIGAVSGSELQLPQQPENQEVRAALRALNDIDEDLLQLIDSALKHHYPGVNTKLLAGLSSSQDDAEATVTVKIMVDRLNDLGAATDDDSSKAMSKLARHGLDAAERERLASLVALAQRADPVAPVDAKTVEQNEKLYYGRLRELRAWYEEWSGVARVAIKRRDQLISLGLAARRTAPDEPAGSEGDGQQ